MKITKEIIKQCLRQIHTDMKITSESCETLINMFGKFESITDWTNLINELNGELIMHARSAADKVSDNKKMEQIIDYLLSEILELAGNMCKGHRLSTIFVSHIWLAIHDDEELSQVFLIPKILRIQTHHKKILPKKVLHEGIKAYGLEIAPDMFAIIHNLIDHTRNVYDNDNDINQKFTSLNTQRDTAVHNSIVQIQHVILSKLFETLKMKHSKVTFTLLQNTVDEMPEFFDYLIPHN